MDEYLATLDRRRHVAVSVSTFHSAAHVAAYSDLVAVLPEDVACAYGPALRIVAPPLPPRGACGVFHTPTGQIAHTSVRK